MTILVAPVATRLTEKEKMILEYLAHRRRTTPSAMIRQAILDAYCLDADSPDGKAALSFFESPASDVNQFDADMNSSPIAPMNSRMAAQIATNTADVKV